MNQPATFDSFRDKLTDLVEAFRHNLAEHKNPSYVEAQLRDDFLNPFFVALGWDIRNEARLIQKKREVEIESRTQIAGRQKRADYLFRVDSRDRFVCEAKKPAEELNARHSFQAKRYAWNKELPLALLTDFEEFKLFVVGGKPHISDPDIGLYKTWRFDQLLDSAKEIWDLLARDSVAAGSIEKLIETLPKRPTGKGKYKQGWLIKPDRSRSLDVDFLNFLDEARRGLAQDLLKENDRADLLEGNRLNEATQKILDRILFLRICEDRDIDTGTRLESLLQTWRRATGKDDGPRRQAPFEFHEEPANYGFAGVKAPKDSLWRSIVRHFRALDRRPPSHVPFFNGNLFKAHSSEELIISDEWLTNFLGELSDDESPYLFAYIPVEILGTIYERFLGKVVRPHGRGVVIEEKPEVRKAGGVYYTPRYIVEYIVSQTVEKLLEGKKPEATLKLRFLDPACGSGSFLIRVFEATCEYWQQYLTNNPAERKKKWCWIERKPGAATDDVHLTMALKRQILLANVYGVDLDPGAVEVTQLSLYLKMLEDENRNTLQRQRDLLPDDDDPLLPPLENNIKCGNSLIASDFSMMPEDLVRVRAFDWNIGFKEIIKAGGFHAVLGNPPYIRIQRVDAADSEYFFKAYETPTSKMDLSLLFVERALRLVQPRGLISFICTSQWLAADYGRNLRKSLSDGRLHSLVDFGSLPVFVDARTYPAILVLSPTQATELRIKRVTDIESITADRIEALVEKCVPLSALGPGPWTMGSLDIANISLRAGVQCEPLSQFGKAYIGTKCGLNEAFVLTREEAAEKKIERKILYPYAYRGGEVDRYMPVEPGSVIIYPYEPGTTGDAVLMKSEDLKVRFPNAYNHLQSFRALLHERQDSRKYYARGSDWYRHLRAGSFRHLRAPKLAIKGVALRCSVGLLKENTAFDGARCPSIILENRTKHSPLYFLAILNSRLATFHLKAVCPPKLHGYIEFTARALTAFPVRPINFANAADRKLHDEVVNCAEKMLAIMPKLSSATSDQERQTLQNAVTATDQQIDALVYELYGLTEDEIKIVEGNS